MLATPIVPGVLWLLTVIVALLAVIEWRGYRKALTDHEEQLAGFYRLLLESERREAKDVPGDVSALQAKVSAAQTRALMLSVAALTGLTMAVTTSYTYSCLCSIPIPGGRPDRVSGHVFWDELPGDGVMATGEQPIAVTVELIQANSGQVVAQQNTQGGSYALQPPAAGVYQVRVVSPPSTKLSAGQKNPTDQFRLYDNTQEEHEENFGFLP